MSDALTLPAEARERAGKGASRQLRRQGRVPAVIYGGKEEPTMIHVEEKELIKQLDTGHFMNSIVELEVDGKKLRTLPKDVALHPVTDRPEHVDFLRLAKGGKALGFLNPFLYAHPEAFHDVTKGTNSGGDSGGKFGFTAIEGWDAASGLGTPNYTALAALV